MMKALLQQANSDNRDERSEAILQIALLLEKHGPGADRDEVYQRILPEHLWSVSLTSADQAALIETLISLIHSSKMTPDMLWALGKTNAITAFIAVITWLRNQSTFTEDATWQALIVVDNFFFLYRDEHGQVDPVIIQIAQDMGMAASLQCVVASGIPKVQPLAEKLLQRIHSRK